MIQKFKFDNNFTGNDSSKSELIHLTFDNLESQKKNAYTQGYQLGKKEAEKEAKDLYDQSLLKTLNSLHESIQSVIDDDITQRNQVIHNIVSITLKIFQKYFPVYLEKAGLGELEEFIFNTVAALKDNSDLIVRVHESYVDEIRKHIHMAGPFIGFSGKIEVMQDTSLRKGDCKILWGSGGCERILSEITVQLEEDLNPILKNTHHTELRNGE